MKLAWMFRWLVPEIARPGFVCRCGRLYSTTSYDATGRCVCGVLLAMAAPMTYTGGRVSAAMPPVPENCSDLGRALLIKEHEAHR